MAYTNWVETELRASAATSGASGQDSSVTIPENVTTFWVIASKTAENDPDNALTVRLQAQVSSLWVDVSWYTNQSTKNLISAADNAADTTATPNMFNADTITPPWEYFARYLFCPSNVIRTVWIASGTGVAITWGAVLLYQLDNFNG